jgi:hypothetical protein
MQRQENQNGREGEVNRVTPLGNKAIKGEEREEEK